ncbi:olfactory receptor 5B21-like [Lissotriton helveticus]
MECQNLTRFGEFLLLGFSDHPQLQIPLFVLFLLMYLVTLIGNTSIIVLVYSDVHLHTPMYAFLCNLSFLDVCYTSVTIPKLLEIHLNQSKAILFVGCMTQLYFFSSIAIAEYYLLAAMAFDRYVAICKPLHYTLTMTKSLCSLLLIASWTSGFLSSVAHTILTSRLSFGHSNVINHLLCDGKAIIQLSCSDTSKLETVIFIEAIIFGFFPFTLICISYIYIISAVLNIRSEEGRRRAFSTCSSHLIVVSLFCGVMICTYIGPASMNSLDKDKILAVLYAAVIPMLNPVIYSLRNRKVKCALKKIREQVSSSRDPVSWLFKKVVRTQTSQVTKEDIARKVEEKQLKSKSNYDVRMKVREPVFVVGDFVRIRKPGILLKHDTTFSRPMKIVKLNNNSVVTQDGQVGEGIMERYVELMEAGSEENSGEGGHGGATSIIFVLDATSRKVGLVHRKRLRF